MANKQGYQERIAAFPRQLSEEMGEVDASKGVCWLDSLSVARVPSQVACVQMDGGRIQIRDRKSTPTRKQRKGF